MDWLRNEVRALLEGLSALWRRATNGSAVRQRLFAIGGGALILLIAGGVVFASMAPRGSAPQQVAQRAQSTATYTATVRPTVKPTVKPTAKPTVRPKPKPIPKAPPPPPLPPTPTPGGSNPTTQFCPTPTPLPAPPTATATTAPTATATSAPAPTASGTVFNGSFVGLTVPSACVTCPYYKGNNPSQSQIASALANAAATYHLPVNLLKAVAWQESRWHEDVTSCDGGIGLMQVQYYTYPWLNNTAVPECGLLKTTDDPYTLAGNADLGAKYLKYLACFWSYWGNVSGASLQNPAPYTIAWYYQQAKLPYPDTKNANGTTNANSFCAAAFTQNAYGLDYSTLPSSLPNEVWSCPYSATTGDTTLLEITISSYNEGAGNVVNLGINNQWYISGVEGYIPQFASGALP